MTPEAEAQIRAEIANLKELLCTKLESVEKITEERFNTQATALKIQAAEYERRLAALNGEAERLRQMQATYLPREIYDTSQQEVIKKVDELRQHKNQGEGKSAGASESWVKFVAIIGFAIAITGILLSAVK